MDTDVGSRIEQLYRHLGYTQHGFSQAIGVSQTSISNVVGGRGSRPSYEMLGKIAKMFPAVSMDWLVTGTGPMLRQLGEAAPVAWDLLSQEQERLKALTEAHSELIARYQDLLKRVAK